MNSSERIPHQKPLEDTIDLMKTLFLDNVPEAHYHGNKVRILFLIGSVLMIITLPFYIERLSFTFFSAIFMIIAIVLFAGATNPRQFWTALFDWIISLLGFSFFEFYVVTTYINYGLDGFMFYCQIMALVFMFALYYSTKTVRGFTLK